MALAQRWVLGKVRNQRVLLQRRNRATQGRIPALAEAIEGMGTYQRQLQRLVDSGEEVLGPEDFEPSPEGAGIWLGPVAKRLLLAELERQLGAAVTYVPQGRKLRLRQILVEQGRSVARCLVERRLDYEAFGLK